MREYPFWQKLECKVGWLWLFHKIRWYNFQHHILRIPILYSSWAFYQAKVQGWDSWRLVFGNHIVRDALRNIAFWRKIIQKYKKEYHRTQIWIQETDFNRGQISVQEDLCRGLPKSHNWVIGRDSICERMFPYNWELY